jgi:membrane associated rhomboid family serine protease
MLIPIKTDRPRLRPAYLTIAIMVVCTLVQILSEVLPGVPIQLMLGGEAVTIDQSPIVVHFGLWGDSPTLLTFFTHQFVHGDLFHLAGNMLFLWIFGSLIEDAIRPWGLAALYLGGGVMAALAHLGITAALGHTEHIPMVGASGAVAAIMGLFMLRFHRTEVEIFYWFGWFWRGTFWVRSMWALAYWIAMELAQGVLSSAFLGSGGGVAHWAHVGGFVAGAAAAPFLGSVSAAKQEYLTDDPETNVEYVRRGEKVAAAEKALRTDPTNAYQMRRLAQAYRHAGEYEQATRSYLQCILRFATRNMLGQAAEVYLELHAYNDGAELPPDILLKLAQHLETDHLRHSVAAYQTLARRFVGQPPSEYALLRLALLQAHSLNQPYEALRSLHEYLSRYPNSQWAGQARALYEELNARQQVGDAGSQPPFAR